MKRHALYALSTLLAVQTLFAANEPTVEAGVPVVCLMSRSPSEWKAGRPATELLAKIVKAADGYAITHREADNRDRYELFVIVDEKDYWAVGCFGRGNGHLRSGSNLLLTTGTGLPSRTVYLDKKTLAVVRPPSGAIVWTPQVIVTQRDIENSK